MNALGEVNVGAQVQSLAANDEMGLVAAGVSRLEGNTWDGVVEMWAWPSPGDKTAPSELAARHHVPCGVGDVAWLSGANLAVAQDDGNVEVGVWVGVCV